MDRPRDQILANARFAAQQHRRSGRRHLRHRPENLLHLWTLADNVVKRQPLAEFHLELEILLAQTAQFQGLQHNRGQVIERERFR